MEITGDIQIEDLVNLCPPSVALLRKFGIRCIQCGEPLWGTLATAAEEKGITDLGPILEALHRECSDREAGGEGQESAQEDPVVYKVAKPGTIGDGEDDPS